MSETPKIDPDTTVKNQNVPEVTDEQWYRLSRPLIDQYLVLQERVVDLTSRVITLESAAEKKSADV